MSRLKINLEAIERDSNANAEGFSADGGVRVGSLLVSSEGVRDSAGHYYELSLNDFDVVPEAEGGFLGRGSSGSVRRAIHRRTGTVVALKEIKVTGKAHMSEIRRELETLHAGDCATPNLVNFYGAFTHEGSVFIAMEAMDGSLQEVAKPLPLPVLACMTRQMLKGLVYLHRTRHLMHRDLKPSNVLYNSRTGDIKISDFGVSSFLECTKADAHSFVGTVTYMSPERLHGDSYSYGADIWSLGLVVAELALGVCPFAGLRGESSEGRFWALIQHLNSPGPALELPADMDHNLADFINACVKKQPEQRATCSELLTHAFIKRYAAAAGSPVAPPPPTGGSTSGVAVSSPSMLSSPHAPRAGLLPAFLSAPLVGFPSGLSRSPIVSCPAVRAFEGLHGSDNSGCGSGPASLQCAASPSTSSPATSSPHERHEGDADENFADHAVIQQWLRARAARHRSRRHCHSSSNRNARASPKSDSTNEGREGKMGGSGTADTLSSTGERAPPQSAAAAGPAEGEDRSPDCDSGDSGSAYVSPDETAGHQHHFDSQQLQGEPSVNLDDELDKLLL